MLMLVWTKDAAIKEALKEAYNVLYLSPPAVFSLSLSLSLSLSYVYSYLFYDL